MKVHDQIARSHPSLQRGVVWCKTCGRAKVADSAYCLQYGWPTCHGETMTIDHPDTWEKRKGE